MSLWDKIKPNFLTSDKVKQMKIDYDKNVLMAEEAIVYNPYEFGSRNIINFHNSRLFSSFPQSYEYNWFVENNIFPSVYFAVHYIAKQVAQLDVEIFKDVKTGEVAKYSRIRYLLNNRANINQSAYDFKYQLVSELYYHGHVWSYADENEIFIIPNHLTVEVNNNYIAFGSKEEINFIRQNYDADCIDLDKFKTVKVISKDDLIFLRMNNFGCGTSPINFLWQELGITRDINQRIKQNVKNGGKKQGVVFSKSKVIGEAAATKINTALSDLMKNGESGAITISGTESSLNLWDTPYVNTSELLQPLKQMREMIQTHLGVPSGLLGGESNQGVDEKVRLFYTDTLSSLLRQIEIEFTNKLYKKKFALNGGAVKFDTERLFFGDITTRTNNALNLYNAGVINKPEVRLKVGLTNTKEIIEEKKEVSNERVEIQSGTEDNG